MIVQQLDIRQQFDVLQQDKSLIAAGRLPSGEILRFCLLGPGVEAQIQTVDGQVKHRCFCSVYEFMLWYAENYVETGSV